MGIVWPLTPTLMQFAFRLRATGGARGLSPVLSPDGELQVLQTQTYLDKNIINKINIKSIQISINIYKQNE